MPTQRSAPVPTTSTTCPEVLCSSSVTCLHCYYDLMCQSQSLSPTSLLHSLASLCSLDHPLLVFRTFPTFLLRILPWMLGPLLRQPLGCFYPFLPPEHRPSPKRQTGRRSARTRATTSARTVFRSCSHSLMFRPPGLLATQVVPTDASSGMAAVTFTSEHRMSCCLPTRRIC